MTNWTFPNMGLLLVRVPLGLFLTIAGLHKIKGGVGNFAGSAAGTIPPWMPTSIGNAYLYAVPWAELVVGVMLAVGLFTRVNAILAALMVLSFTIAVTGPWDGDKPFNANLIYLGIALAIALLGPGRISIDAFIPKRRRP